MSDWFARAGFGMFVHWDHASQQGLEVSWPLVGGLPLFPGRPAGVEEYHSSAKTFDPAEWDAAALARTAREAGMTYAVLTSKHHSGYAMFFSKLSEFTVEHSPFGRDIVREFCDAMGAEGLRAGLYYSLSDWHHPDYPAFREEDKPYMLGQSPPLPSDAQWERYLEYLFGQITELLTNYGPIATLWFDGQWERTADMWRTGELRELIRSLQPDCLVNDRLPGQGDFETPEQFVPAQPLAVPWETCMTMNDSWGYVPEDRNYKPVRQLVHTLCETAGRGGNLLLNVSPMGTGALPREQVSRLAAIGDWMAANGEAIVGTEPGLEPWQFYGPSTRRDGTVYVHLLMRPYDTVTVRGLPVRRVRGVRELRSGEPLKHTIRTSIPDLFSDDPHGEVVITVPPSLVDDNATVLALDVSS